jgi:ATP-dependent DNA helicase RecQ
VKDIQEKLHFAAENVIGISFERPNLVYIVRHAEDKEKILVESCKNMAGSGIVYCGTRARTKEVAGMLEAQGIVATYYHAGMDQEARKASADRWFKNKVRVMCATNAFGMGIDKPDVRFVLHADLPPNPENYFQEAGRAGRDGKTAYAGLFWREADLEKLDEFIEARYPPKSSVQAVYQALCSSAQLAIGAGAFTQLPLDNKALSERTGYDARTVYNCLQLLERTGYLELNEFARGGSKLHIPMRKEHLYNFQVAHPDHDPFIRLLLRMYGGLFENYISIREAEIAKASGLPIKSVNERLLLMDKLGVVAYEKKLGGASCTLLQPRVQEKNVLLPAAIYEDRRQADTRRALAIKRFVQTDKCRSVQLLEYFGEVNPPVCRRCDVCKEKESAAKAISAGQGTLQKAETLLLNGPMTMKELSLQLKLSLNELTRIVRWQVDEGLWEVTAKQEVRKKHIN